MRRAAKIDRTQTAIVAALRRCGCKVAITSDCRATPGFPDLVVCIPPFSFTRHKALDGRWRTVLVEVKDGGQPPSKRALTASEAAFHAQWKGDLRVICSVDEALALVSER